MKTCLLLLIFSLSIIHQGQAQQNNRSEELTSIRVSPRDAMGGNVADFCDSVRYIPLETKKKAYSDLSVTCR